jgi:hypothetical protein
MANIATFQYTHNVLRIKYMLWCLCYRCGSRRRSTMSRGQQLFTGSASKLKGPLCLHSLYLFLSSILFHVSYCVWDCQPLSRQCCRIYCFVARYNACIAPAPFHAKFVLVVKTTTTKKGWKLSKYLGSSILIVLVRATLLVLFVHPSLRYAIHLIDCCLCQWFLSTLWSYKFMYGISSLWLPLAASQFPGPRVSDAKCWMILELMTECLITSMATLLLVILYCYSLGYCICCHGQCNKTAKFPLLLKFFSRYCKRYYHLWVHEFRNMGCCVYVCAPNMRCCRAGGTRPAVRDHCRLQLSFSTVLIKKTFFHYPLSD